MYAAPRVQVAPPSSFHSASSTYLSTSPTSPTSGYLSGGAKGQSPFRGQWGLLPSVGNREDYPLVRAACAYRLVDVYQAAELQHTFTSKAVAPSDVAYVFPLPPDASVYAFRALIDEQLVEGVVMEKAEARATFESAVAMNQKAALLQQENVEIFRLMLGNVAPGQTVVVSISYSSLIAQEGQGSLDTLRLTFPTTIAPRYGAPPGAQQNSFYQPATSPADASTLDLELSVELGAPIKSIMSPSHPITSALGRATRDEHAHEEFDVQKAFISLSSFTFLDRDVVIVLECRGLDKQRCIVETSHKEDGSGDETDAYALSFVPRFALPTLPRQEYIFLVDRSGSMSTGAKLPLLRSSLQIMLRSLPPVGTTFNLVSFGSHTSALWSASMPYATDTLAAAAEHVDGMSANYGGTEMRAALATAFSARAPAEAGVPTSVFVLTDGQCYDLDGVQRAIRAAVMGARGDGRGFTRLFCMGIGDAVSKAMCTAIARAGEGGAVFVGERERPDAKLVALVRAAAGPPVDDLRVDWGFDGVDTETSSRMNGLDFPMGDAATAFGAAHGALGAPSAAAWSAAADVGAPLSLFDEAYEPGDARVPDSPFAGADVPSRVPTVRLAPPADAPPPLLPGFRFTLCALVTRRHGSFTPRSAEVRISGRVLGRPLELRAPVSPISPTTHGTALAGAPLVHLVAARTLVQALEDEAPLREHTKTELVRLGLEFGIATSQTSFVAVLEDGERRGLLLDIDPPQLAPQPAMPGFAQRQSSLPGMPRFGSNSSSPIQAKSATLPSPPIEHAPAFRARAVSSRPSSTMHAQKNTPYGVPQKQGQAGLDAYAEEARDENLFSPEQAQTSTMSSVSGSGSVASPALSELSLAPQSGLPPRFLDGDMPMSPIEERAHAMFGTPPFGAAHTHAPMPAPAPAPSMLGFSRRGIKKKSTGSSGTASAAPSRTSTADSIGEVPADEDGDAVRASVEGLARAQAFDGSFAPRAPLARLFAGTPALPPLPPTLAAAVMDEKQKAAVWCTLLAVAFLQVRFAEEEGAWIILRDKATAWVHAALAGATVQDVDEAIKAILEAATEVVKSANATPIV